MREWVGGEGGGQTQTNWRASRARAGAAVSPPLTLHRRTISGESSSPQHQAGAHFPIWIRSCKSHAPASFSHKTATTQGKKSRNLIDKSIGNLNFVLVVYCSWLRFKTVSWRATVRWCASSARKKRCSKKNKNKRGAQKVSQVSSFNRLDIPGRMKKQKLANYLK